MLLSFHYFEWFSSNFNLKATRPLQPILVGANPWYLCGMDIIKALVHSNGFHCFLTMTDYFTKMSQPVYLN